jgi:hypothetical protein
VRYSAFAAGQRRELPCADHVGGAGRDAAVVPLEEEGCWGDISFVDYFSLARIDGEWKTVNKTFTHGGGHLPESP